MNPKHHIPLLCILLALAGANTVCAKATLNWTMLGNTSGFPGDAASKDAYFEARLDFRDKPAADSTAEVIWESGTPSSGFSLLYLPGNRLGLYLSTGTSGGPELAITYTLPQRLIDRTEEIPVQWSVDLRGNGNAAIALWVDDEHIQSVSGAVANQQWSNPVQAGFGIAYNNIYSDIGGVTPSAAGVTGFSALGVGPGGSIATIDSLAGLRYWYDRQLTNTEFIVQWDPVRIPQHLQTPAVSGVQYYLRKSSAGSNVLFTAAAPDEYARWYLLPVAQGSEWMYLINDSAVDLLYARARPDGLVVCNSLADPDGTYEAQWKWDGPAPAPGSTAIFQRLRNRVDDASQPRHLTIENTSGDNKARVATGVASSSTSAQWTKSDYSAEGVPTAAQIVGATMPYTTIQAEAGPLGGATLYGNATVYSNDTREEDQVDNPSLGTIYKGTAREAIGRKCVALTGPGQGVDFEIPSGVAGINFISVRYSIPDSSDGSVKPLPYEASVTVMVKRVGDADFSQILTKQPIRLDTADSHYAMKGDTAFHSKLYLHNKYIWGYWRYHKFRGKTGDEPVRDPRAIEEVLGILDYSSLQNEATSCVPLSELQAEWARLYNRNKVDVNGDGNPNDAANANGTISSGVDWIAPLVTQRFGEIRAFLDVGATPLAAGDKIRLVKANPDTAASYIVIDQVEFENVAAAVTMPSGFVSITSKGAIANDSGDDTNALISAIADVRSGSAQGVWIPAGFFRIGSRIDFNYGDNVVIQGAGMAHTILFGWRSGEDFPDLDYDPTIPESNPQGYRKDGFRHFGFNAMEGGVKLVLSDMSIVGDGTNRDDGGKGVGGSIAPGSKLSRLYFENLTNAVQTLQTAATDAAYQAIPIADDFAGISYSQPHSRTHGLEISDCRIRRMTAGGFIIVSGAHNVLIRNCHVRGTADDCYAVWSTSSGPRNPTMACTSVVFRDCTGEAPARGGGFGVYGGYRNLLENVVAQDTNATGFWITGNYRPLDFGQDEYETTIVRDFKTERCGRADSYDVLPSENSSAHPYDSSKPGKYRPGAKIFRGALRLGSATYYPLDECGDQDIGQPTFQRPVRNVLIQGGYINDSTNDAICIDSYIDIAGSKPAFENVVLSNVTVDGVPQNTHEDVGISREYYEEHGAVVAVDDYLAGSVVMNKITTTGLAGSSVKLRGPPFGFSLLEPGAGGTWIP